MMAEFQELKFTVTVEVEDLLPFEEKLNSVSQNVREIESMLCLMLPSIHVVTRGGAHICGKKSWGHQ